VTLGHYEQDNNLDNGPEAIEWIVLDVQEGKSLLISKYSLDAYNYADSRGLTEWKHCSLRRWLSETFFKEALSQAEQSMICISEIDNRLQNGTVSGSITNDTIFLISDWEAKNYFKSDEARECHATDYAKANGLVVNEKNICGWWLRTSDPERNTAGVVFRQGQVSSVQAFNSLGKFKYNNTIGIRPALWIDLEKIEEKLENEKTKATIVSEWEDYRTVGKTVTLGRYEQDNNPDNGLEAIEWTVLDVQDGKSLLISRYILDCKSFNDKTTQQYTWDKSGSRKWLNNDYLNEAFSNAEQKLLQEALLENAIEDSGKQIKGGSDTKDRVFLLSKSEVLQYFPGNEDRVCTATERAINQGLSTGKNGSGWWLRAPGYVDSSAYWNKYIPMRCIDDQGCLVYRTSSKLSGVRPAIWINLGAVDDVVSEAAIQKTWELLHKKGSTITFGRYEQDNSLDNGQEPIEWTVLDVQDGKALLISKYGLDSQPYSKSRQNTTWEWSNLRSWLNGEFLTKAFQSDEQKTILKGFIDNSRQQQIQDDISGGNDTYDRLFVLSYGEAVRYFAGDDNRSCKATDYAISQGAAINAENNCWWWLRSPAGSQTGALAQGGNMMEAITVLGDGSFTISSVNMEGRAVRPALWIDLNSDYFSID